MIPHLFSLRLQVPQHLSGWPSGIDGGHCFLLQEWRGERVVFKKPTKTAKNKKNSSQEEGPFHRVSEKGLEKSPSTSVFIVCKIAVKDIKSG